MTAPGSPAAGSGGRFPGFDALAQARHWDAVTAGVVLSRLGKAPDIRFFTPAEQAVATVLCDLLLGQDSEPRVPVLEFIDARLAGHETDGWRYEDMPEDGEAWRNSLRHLDDDAQAKFGCPFARCPADDQRALIRAVQDIASGDWHGMVAAHVWSLWTRYVCTVFYAHPQAWSEIGFPGPAYPRGYKNPAVGAREPFEVGDVVPSDDPVRGAS